MGRHWKSARYAYKKSSLMNGGTHRMLAKKVHLHNLSNDDQLLAPTYGQRCLDKPLPRFEIPESEMAPQTAYNVIRDELMLDGNARLNLATFVTTWMEPEARRLMAETFE